MRSTWFTLSLVAGLALAVAACSPPPTPYHPPPPEELIEQSREASRLGTGDIFEVRVFDQKELSGLHRVTADGTIRFPLIGVVEVVGLTPPEVSERLAERLRDGYLREPHVEVFVKEQVSSRVFVLGAVRKPGTFPFDENMTIVKALTLAGGFTDLANQNATVVTRSEDETEKRYIVPVEDIYRGDTKNFILRPGDIVFVPEGVL